ncbi:MULTISPECIES: AraC family transcriptional regulator [Zobellia]|uniref:AraC family transcriptional regulator n=1 Tax=Zobellia TaxID=112040 RepID=UPI001BFF4CB3|nr:MULTISPECIES: AraC family transcriptional regulator [Zobellia]MBT9189574.1 helix-turn-helix transcriptional regulator [Zobellia russellii]MDO6519556.1 AraC family transcriptional regulator [Zobellia uliginosa]
MNNQPNKNFYEIYSADRCESLISAADSGDLEVKGLRRSNYPGLKLPDEVLPGIYSLGYWDAKKNQDWGLGWHRNEGIEFTFLSSGGLDFSLGNETFKLRPGNLTVTRPWQLHRVGNPNITVGKLYWMIIDVDVRQPHQDWIWPDWIVLSKKDLSELTKILRQNEMPVWKTSEVLNVCFTEIGKCIEESKTEGQIPHSKLTILINQLLLQMLDLFRKGQVELDESLIVNLRTVEIFLDHLQTDFERHWTLDEMAGHCGMGITSLTKYCKQLSNLTPINYLIKIRLEAAAKMLLDDEDKGVGEISYDCGFSSSQYFATTFRKQYAVSPKDYRANLLLAKK